MSQRVASCNLLYLIIRLKTQDVASRSKVIFVNNQERGESEEGSPFCVEMLVFLIFLLILVQFHSLSIPVLVMSTVYLAIAGSVLFKPLAITIISGLLFSMMLTLVVVPALYTVLAIWKQKKAKRKRGDQVADRQVEATV